MKKDALFSTAEVKNARKKFTLEKATNKTEKVKVKVKVEELESLLLYGAPHGFSQARN